MNIDGVGYTEEDLGVRSLLARAQVVLQWKEEIIIRRDNGTCTNRCFHANANMEMTMVLKPILVEQISQLVGPSRWN